MAEASPRTRTEAQRRADRILAFREELADAERDGAVALGPDERARLGAYHDTLLAELTRRFDVDVSERNKQLSRGMQVVALLGAIALGASVVLYFVRIWGLLSTASQVTLLLGAPVVSLAATELTLRRDRLRFMTGLLAAVTFACFVLDVDGLSRIFGIAPAPGGLLAYGLFALTLAYAYGQRLLLAAGLVCLAAYLAALSVQVDGAWWMDAVERPEGIVLAFAAAASLAALPHRTRDDFPPVIRAVGLLGVCVGLLALSRAGEMSWSGVAQERVETFYQVTGFVVTGAAIWLGIRRQWPEVTYFAAAFFALFLFIKFVDWWWDWMPRYLFFLVIGLTSLALLWLFVRLRGRPVRP